MERQESHQLRAPLSDTGLDVPLPAQRDAPLPCTQAALKAAQTPTWCSTKAFLPLAYLTEPPASGHAGKKLSALPTQQRATEIATEGGASERGRD